MHAHRSELVCDEADVPLTDRAAIDIVRPRNFESAADPGDIGWGIDLLIDIPDWDSEPELSTAYTTRYARG